MKAFCYSYFGSGHFKWCEACPVPTVGRNDVLVRMAGSSFNHMDYFSAQIPMVRVAQHNRPGGFDLSGTVVALGKDVRNFSLGDRVYGFGQGFAEYAKVKPSMISAAPEVGADLVDLAGYPSVGVTALQILKKHWLDLSFADRVKNIVIIGASGGVGSSLVQLSKHFGSPDMAITAISSGKNEFFCKSLGATGFIDYTKIHNAELSSVISKNSVDLVFDTVSGNIGTPNYVNDGLSLLNHTGVYVSTNSMRPKDYLNKAWETIAGPSPCNHQFELFIMNPLRATKDLRELTLLIEQGKFKLPIDGRVPFTEPGMREGLAKVERRHASGKTVIRVSLP